MMRYLYEKEDIIYASCDNCGKILKFRKYELDEIKTGVECFCGHSSNRIDGFPNEKKNEHIEKSQQQVYTCPTPAQYSTSPKCPTCGSTNVSKISLTSKAVGGAMFGLFSSNIRNTFKCNKCGYKW